MLMTDKEIKKAIEDKKLIMKNYSEDCLEPSSYDMRVGNKAVVSGKDKEIDVKKEQGVVIHPGEFAIITTFENVKMPPDIAGHIGVKSYYTRKGLILLAGLQIDPGFGGVLVLGVYNAAPRRLTLDYLSSFCTVEFHQLSSPVEKPYEGSMEQIKGEIPRVDKDYLRTIETQSLSELAESLRSLTVNVSTLTKAVYAVVIPLLSAIFVAALVIFVAKLF